ncbi:heavy metal translocating P-type ATPase [Intrasporangium sp.]|uniref:heavy metal translocating P-type ATPase n=1 Tax=Intrasporangium sp. TaxID=1925024 RepID=UPI00293B4212|nr:heavy metal translocating P-type ATPase [Intrasporangium sp.]MDV3221944.1 heavy metal translocating P-type ATPase [Intrasporangium sp.]
MSPHREGDLGRPGAGDLLSKLRDRAGDGSRSRTSPRSSRTRPSRDQPGPDPSAWPSPGEPGSPEADQRLLPDSTPPRALRTRLLVAAALTVAVVVLAIASPDSAVGRWGQLVLAIPVVTWCAWPFHRSAARAARRLSATTESLVLLGVVVASLHSLLNLVTGAAPLRFAAAAAVTMSLLTVRFVEGVARDRLRQDETRLATLGTDDVSLLRIDPRTRTTSEVRAPVQDLVVGDQFIVRPGETVAADGVVLDGSSTVDPGHVTGSGTEEVTVGDRVLSGSTNRTGRLVVEAHHVGSQTLLAHARALLASTGSGRAPFQRLAERIATWLIPGVLAVAGAAAAMRLWSGHSGAEVVDAAVAVLVAASPTALLLAAPTAVLAGAGRAARLGILVRGPEVLDTARRVETILLDKSGTVTTGELELESIAVVGRLSKKAALTAAAAVEQGSDHPIAQAIVAGAQLARIELPRIRDFEANPGEGAAARIKDTEVTVGKAALFEQVDDVLLEHARTHSGTTVYVGWEGRARAALTVQDPVRGSSKGAIARLARVGVTPYLLTGDAEASAHDVAEEVGIDPGKVRPEVRASDRVAVVTALQRQGRVVARLGEDGEDEPALHQADLALVRARSAAAPLHSADVVLLRTELDAAADAIELTRRVGTVLRQNFWWATGYHVVAIPLAALGLLPPAAAGAAMAVASLAVVANSVHLSRSPAPSRHSTTPAAGP